MCRDNASVSVAFCLNNGVVIHLPSLVLVFSNAAVLVSVVASAD